MAKKIEYRLRVEIKEGGSAMEEREAKELFERQLKNKVINAGCAVLKVVELAETNKRRR